MVLQCNEALLAYQWLEQFQRLAGKPRANVAHVNVLCLESRLKATLRGICACSFWWQLAHAAANKPSHSQLKGISPSERTKRSDGIVKKLKLESISDSLSLDILSPCSSLFGEGHPVAGTNPVCLLSFYNTILLYRVLSRPTTTL